MPVLKSTMTRMRAKYEAEASRLVRRIEYTSAQWRGANDERDAAQDAAADAFEQRDAARIQRDATKAALVIALKSQAHQHTELERMTHERNEALGCMNVYGLVIDGLLDECDELRAAIADLTSEIVETPDPVTIDFTILTERTFVVDLAGTVSCGADFVGQAA